MSLPLPVRDDLLAYLNQEAAAGREIHLATAADRTVATAIAQRFPIFKSVQSTDQNFNLKGPHKAARLKELFPDGICVCGRSSRRHSGLAKRKGSDHRIRETRR